MSRLGRPVTVWLGSVPPWVLATYAIVASFSTYFCMYAFRKPFAAATFEDQYFLGTTFDLKVALVISQIIGYTISKYVGIKVCSEITPPRRAVLLVVLILAAESALVLYGAVPNQFKVVAIFLNGLPLGMVWGLVVWYLEGRRISEVLLAGLSCSFILASGVVKNVGQWLMGTYHVSEGWMPAATAALFLLPFLVAVWLLNQVPKPTQQDEQARTHRQPMDRAERVAFFKQFLGGLLLLLIAYFFLTAYRDYRDNFQVNLFNALDYPHAENKVIITQTEMIVMFGVMVPLALLFLIKNNWYGLIGTFTIMTTGVLILGVSTWALEAGWIDGFWWMTLTGLGAYLAYVPYGSVLFDRLIASAHMAGTAVFAIYLMDAVGYSGSILVLLYEKFAYNADKVEGATLLGFFIDFTYFMSILGAIMLVSSAIYFTRTQKHERGKNRR